jgi:hypothetical protein
MSIFFLKISFSLQFSDAFLNAFHATFPKPINKYLKFISWIKIQNLKIQVKDADSQLCIEK